MEFYTLASSSAGNAAVLHCGGTTVLLDAGISARRIEQSLAAAGLSVRALDAVLVTHEHSDHTGGIEVLARRFGVPVYATAGTAACLRCPRELLRPFAAGDRFAVGELEITSFRTSHDACDSVDYRFDCADGSVGALTDTGCVTDAAAETLSGVDLLLLEANHDVDMLRDGPYPYHLKRRILGERGHLSNDAAAAFALACARAGTRDILLAHLSAENNTPAAAEHAVARALQTAELSIRLGVAPRDRLSERHEVQHSCRTSPSFA